MTASLMIKAAAAAQLTKLDFKSCVFNTEGYCIHLESKKKKKLGVFQ